MYNKLNNRASENVFRASENDILVTACLRASENDILVIACLKGKLENWFSLHPVIQSSNQHHKSLNIHVCVCDIYATDKTTRQVQKIFKSTYTQSFARKFLQFLLNSLLDWFFFLKLFLAFVQQNRAEGYVFFRPILLQNNFFLRKRNLNHLV